MTDAAGKPQVESGKLNPVLAEYIRRRERGEAVDVESLCQAHPDLADALRSYAAGEGLVEALAGDADPSVVDSAAARDAETLRPGAAQNTDRPAPGNFGKYQILRTLGEGAMGAIYLARDTNLDRDVALKVPKFKGIEGPEFRQRFSREARAAAKLDHPGICRVYDADEVDGTPFICMAYLDGQPLSRFVGTPEFQDQRRVAEVIREIASALAHAHQQGVLHRDLKPGNVMLLGNGAACVTDFGLARHVNAGEESRLTHEGTILGTPAYMSPEQIEGHADKIGPGTDIYALGVILYELLASRLPFTGPVMAILGKALRDRPTPLCKLRSDVHSELEDLCLQMLEKSADKRPASMQEVVNRLETWLKHTSPAAQAAEAKAQTNVETLEAMKGKILDLIQRGQFAAAVTGLEKMTQVKVPGGAEYVQWARTKLREVKQAPKQLREGVPALLATARQCFDRHDYAQAAQVLQDIPQDFRTAEGQQLLDQCIELQDEADLLLTDLQDCVKRKQFQGIEPNLKRFLQLKPGNKFAKDLHESLQTYSKIPWKQRKYRYDDRGRLLPRQSALADNWLLWGAVCGALVFGAMYYGIMIYLKSGDQTIAVEVDEQWLAGLGGDATLVVDGDREVAIRGGNEELTITAGDHGFTVKRGDTVIHNPQTFGIAKAGRQVLRIDATGMHIAVPAAEPSNGTIAPAGSEGSPAAVAPAVAASPQAPVPIPEEVDLLAALDPPSMGDSEMKWERKGTTVVGTGIGPAGKSNWKGFRFPAEIGGDYVVELDFLQRAFWPVQIDFPLQDAVARIHMDGETCGWMIDADKSQPAAVPTWTNPAVKLKTNVLHQLVVRVRQHGTRADVEATLDGVTMGTFSGERSRFNFPAWVKPNFKQVLSGSLCNDLSQGYIELRRAVYRPLPAPQVATDSPSRNSTDGWNDLFNGRDLTGWSGLNGYWTWSNGELVGTLKDRLTQRNTVLRYDRTFRDFEIEYEMKLEGEQGGNSGLQVRSELMDPAIFLASGPQVDAGGVHWGGLSGELFDNTIMQAANPARTVKLNDYNQFHVRCVGKRITITLNGTVTVDGEFPTIADVGIIGWQLNGRVPSTVRIRNVRIRELNTPNAGAAVVPNSDAGWTDLFNGRDLTGWKAVANQDWRVVNGVLTNDAGPRSALWTTQEYADFELDLEFKLSNATNSGIWLRAPGNSEEFPRGFEIQILDDPNVNAKDATPLQRSGSVYNILAPRVAAYRTAVWNHMVIRLFGRQLRVLLNDQEIQNVSLDQLAFPTGFGDAHQRAAGYIGLQTYGGKNYDRTRDSKLEFRNLRIRKLNTQGAPLVTQVASPAGQGSTAASVASSSIYELRVETCVPGKLSLLSDRFRDVTCRLMEKHGMRIVAFWTPAVGEPASNSLVYLLEHNSRAAADASWSALQADPEWLSAEAESVRQQGQLVAKSTERTFLASTDYSPPIGPVDPRKVYELRTYQANPGKLGLLNSRFRDHTKRLLEKHGMTSVGYWLPTDPPASGNTFVYLLAHDSPASQTASWAAFTNDPEWKSVREASEAAGPLLSTSPQKLLLKATDYSRRTSAALGPQPTSGSASAEGVAVFPSDGRFTSARALVEVNQGEPINAYPWISPDGLALYWTRETPKVDSTMMQATRPSIEAPFGEIKPVLRHARLASVSPDGLEIVCPFDANGDGNVHELCTSRRASTAVEFPTPQAIPAFSGLSHALGSAFTEDSRTLILLAATQSNATRIVYRSERSGPGAPWGTPRAVTIPNTPPEMDKLTWPSLAGGGKYLVFSYSDPTNPPFEWGCVADATSDPLVFANPRHMLLDGQKFIVRGGRYCPATGELFYTHTLNTPPFEKMEIRVAKAVVPRSIAGGSPTTSPSANSVLANAEPSNPPTDAQPPEIQKALNDLKFANEAAGKKLLRAFDQEIEQIRTAAKLSADERVVRIRSLEAEQDLFERFGHIPFALALRSEAAKYLRTLAESRQDAAKVYDRLIESLVKQKNDQAASQLRSQRDRDLGPQVIATWRTIEVNGGKVANWAIWSNGSVGAADRQSLWFMDERRFAIQWFKPPNTRWVDTFVFGDDCMQANIVNEKGERVLTGTRVGP